MMCYRGGAMSGTPHFRLPIGSILPALRDTYRIPPYNSVHCSTRIQSIRHRISNLHLVLQKGTEGRGCGAISQNGAARHRPVAFLLERAPALFRTDRFDLLGLDLDFYAQRRTHVAPLHDPAAHPHIAHDIRHLQWIVQCVAARIAHQRVRRVLKIVFAPQLIHVGDVLERAAAIRGLSRKCPITGGPCGGPCRQADNRSRDVFAGGQIVNKKVRGRPRLGEVGDSGNHRIRGVRVWQQRRRIGWGRRHFQLRSGFQVHSAGRSGVCEPTNGENQNNSKYDNAHDQRRKRIGAIAAKPGRDTRNRGHLSFEPRVGGILVHRADLLSANAASPRTEVPAAHAGQ